MASRKAASSTLRNAAQGIRSMATQYPRAADIEGKHYDVIVVGGGIFGCTSAHMLKQTGKRVALLEARNIGCATTANSTAKLSAQQSLAYSMIAKERGKDVARSYYDMTIGGVRKAEEIIRTLKLDCELETRSHATWTNEEDKVPMIKSEYEICKEIGIDCELIGTDELLKEFPASLYPKIAVRFNNQAQFDSYKYCVELARHIPGDGCEVYEAARVVDVSDPVLGREEPHTLTIADAPTKLTGDKVILATHMPIINRSLHFAILDPSRSHCIAVRINNEGPGAGGKAGASGTGAAAKSRGSGGKDYKMHNMFISVGTPMRSTRTKEDDSILVVSGEGFPMGDVTDTELCYANLEHWARTHFDVTEVVKRWSAHDYYSVDHVPFIGYLHRGTHSLFTATGFSKWGLANGVAAASIITDLIDGRHNPYHDMVDARRWDLTTQFKGLSMESAHTARHFVVDKVKRAVTMMKIGDLTPGHGGIVRAGLKTVGAYRDEKGELHVIDPVCTHLGCDLVFNTGDKAWDCPCHGSRFDLNGEVLEGPAVKPLCKHKDLEW
eukprot:jgi/Mesvir1/2093/Mv16625-RA.1